MATVKGDVHDIGKNKAGMDMGIVNAGQIAVYEFEIMGCEVDDQEPAGWPQHPRRLLDGAPGPPSWPPLPAAR